MLPAHALSIRTLSGIFFFVGCAEVMTRREVLALAFQDDHADIAVLIGFGERVIHLLEHEARLRVLIPWPVQDHLRDTIGFLVPNMLVGHWWTSFRA